MPDCTTGSPYLPHPFDVRQGEGGRAVISEREARLVRRAQQGDPEAFAELYERYQPTIYTYIFYRVGDAEAAEDLTADVFVRLVEKIHTFQVQDRPLLSWLYTI
ncbi:MAG TPA: hypothetical protein ENK56_05825, partial [Chloroflexi bacterium]|nr:hypothetical protein [Chloroflexota bacterium]